MLKFINIVNVAWLYEKSPALLLLRLIFSLSCTSRLGFFSTRIFFSNICVQLVGIGIFIDKVISRII